MTKKCSKSVSQHIDLIGSILGDAGIMFPATCEQTYQAIMEVAEVIRLLNGFETYAAVNAERYVVSAKALDAALAANDTDAAVAAFLMAHPEVTTETAREQIGKVQAAREQQLSNFKEDFRKLLEAFADERAAARPSKAVSPLPRKRFDD